MKDSDINVVGLSSNQTKGKTNWKVMGAIIGIVVLAFGVVAGIILVRQQQNISEKASNASCDEQCPGSDGRLYNCHPPEVDGSPSVSICYISKRVEFCGTTNFCCPVAGGQWTTDMTACNATAASSPTATPTLSSTAAATSTSTSKATATSTSKATSTSSSKATSTSKASSTATAVPIPVTGVEWPTVVGGGFGIIMILVSLALAL